MYVLCAHVYAKTEFALYYASLKMKHKRYKKKKTIAKTMGNILERATGIEPAHSAWEADVLPLNYARENQNSSENRAELMELVM